MICVQKISLPAADLGPVNPLPDIHNNSYIHAGIRVTERVAEEDRTNINKGMIPTLLPYLAQDNYDRDRKLREFSVIVLENEFLRAEFLPQLGGRLRRLYDKEHGRELLYVNPVFQPCNLALRNAWFSGGVEFNVGIKGHSPFTCAPVFAEKRVDREGQEYVSFYEYERIRGIVWSVSACLPEGARALTLRCAVENCSDREVPMYWWSNIAVPEEKGLRVIVPAKETFVNYFGEDSYVLDMAPLPNGLGWDMSYPENAARSLDFFYKIPKESPKWIASANGSGNGLLHYSDATLYGRKLFVWGQGAGGRHWGEYLSQPGQNYVEIQAGLAHTQLEHFPMAPHSKIQWVEGYAPLRADGTALHGDWDGAIACVQAQLDALEQPEPPQLFQPIARELLFCGSGWGALEEQLRGSRISSYFDFPRCADPETDVWNRLLEQGYLPEELSAEPPKSYVTGPFWEEKLRASLAYPKGQHWLTCLHLGVNLYEQGCRGNESAMAQCLRMWERSLHLRENPWAHRNLAAFYANEEDFEKAVSHALAAFALLPENRNLAVDCGQILIKAKAYSLWLGLKLPETVAQNGRVRLLRARALLALDRLEEAGQILNEAFEMPDIKEGELSVSRLWFELQGKLAGISPEEAEQRFKLPYSLDFRTH